MAVQTQYRLRRRYELLSRFDRRPDGLLRYKITVANISTNFHYSFKRGDLCSLRFRLHGTGSRFGEFSCADCIALAYVAWTESIHPQ